MASTQPERHPSIYLLSDHLDAALAMGEDLLTEKLALDAPARQSSPPCAAGCGRTATSTIFSPRCARSIRHDGTAPAGAQAGRGAQSAARPRLKPLIALFVAGTAPLADAAAELGDTDARDFDAADAALTFLRSRGLIAADAAGLDGLRGSPSARTTRSPAASGSAPSWTWSPRSSTRSTCCSISTWNPPTRRKPVGRACRNWPRARPRKRAARRSALPLLVSKRRCFAVCQCPPSRRRRSSASGTPSCAARRYHCVAMAGLAFGPCTFARSSSCGSKVSAMRKAAIGKPRSTAREKYWRATEMLP